MLLSMASSTSFSNRTMCNKQALIAMRMLMNNKDNTSNETNNTTGKTRKIFLQKKCSFPHDILHILNNYSSICSSVNFYLIFLNQ
jgi:hypothetical protein